jgi:hypothetical protein
MTNISHNYATIGFSSVLSPSANKAFFYFSTMLLNVPLNEGICFSRLYSKCSTWCSEKLTITNMLYIDTFMIAFPMKVAPKKTLNGIKKWPHVRPAKSNKGLGIYMY